MSSVCLKTTNDPEIQVMQLSNKFCIDSFFV